MLSTDRLFPALLGPAFDDLPAPVRDLHLAPGGTRFVGRASVVRGAHPIAKLMAWATRLPPAGEVDVEVRIDVDGGGERWLRRFGAHAMPSRLWADGIVLRERLGLAEFDFMLEADAGGLRWRVVGARALGLPLPVRWFAGVSAHESARDGRYVFDVRAALPAIGLLVHYRGTLDAG